MVISKTPFRMSFFGGGTDYPEFYKEHGGSVLSTTFDKYCYLIVRHLPRFFEYSSHILYSKIEKVNSIDEIVHPAIRETMRYLDMHELNVEYDADLPARAGLGSSSSFVVGMLNAFYALKGKYADKRKLADEAIYIERVMCKESGGVQDQIAVSYGGLNRIDFFEDGYSVVPVIISQERKQKLNENLLLFFTGFSRNSFEIAIEQKASIRQRTDELKEMLLLVKEAEKILTDSSADLCEFGKLLDKEWNIKRLLSGKISNPFIDSVYQKAMDAGAIGGKLLGAGGGGFMLFFVQPDKQKYVKAVLKDLMHVPFEFESEGARILYYVPEKYDKKLD